MRSGLVVVKSPNVNGAPGLLQRLKAVLIQTFIPKLALKALDVSVLSRATWLNQDMLNSMLLHPSHKCSASKLWPVVCPDSFGVAPKRSGSVQKTGHVIPTNAKVGRDVHALVREVVSYCQAFDAPRDSARPTNSITDEVHAPSLAFSDRQVFSGVQAVHPFVLDARELGAQNVVNHAVTPAPSGVGGLNDLVAQLHIERTGLALMAIGISA